MAGPHVGPDVPRPLESVTTNKQNIIVFHLPSPCVHRSPPNFACHRERPSHFCTPNFFGFNL